MTDTATDLLEAVAEAEAAQPSEPDDGDTDESRNNRSTIAFPYTHLGEAERVVRALHNRQTASLGEVAAALDTTTSSGTFRTKISSARVFDVVKLNRGKVSLTDLGRRLLDPKQVEQARLDAFLKVPLYKALYEKFDGTVLPGTNKDLEDTLESLGVSPKQADRARQTLQRSAEIAGFFRSGTNRLVKPALAGAGESDTQTEHPSTLEPVAGLSPMMAQMWLTLLRGEGKNWPPEKIAEFVKAAQRLDKVLAS